MARTNSKYIGRVARVKPEIYQEYPMGYWYCAVGRIVNISSDGEFYRIKRLDDGEVGGFRPSDLQLKREQ